ELFASIDADTTMVTSGRLVTHFEDRVGLVTDRSKVARILLNLVENAGKYAPSGSIELLATSAGNEVCFRVVDHGPGIPAAERQRVVEGFVPLDQSSTRRRGGTGVGLPLCPQLAGRVAGRGTLSGTA